MSFGFSIGDFLAVIELVTKLRKDFADAPSQIRDLSTELKTFSIVLQDTEIDLTVGDLDPNQIESLESALSSARQLLKDLDGFIGRNKEISTATGSKSRVHLKRVWKRLSFDQQEVDRFRLQIISSTTGLKTFTLNEVKHNTRKIARYVDDQIQRGVLTWLSDDDFNYHKSLQSHLVHNRQPGTRKWLLESDEWESWLGSKEKTLYCPGIPGSGKTFTTAMVIENIDCLSKRHDWIFAYVFCSYQQRKENMCEILLRSLLRMILEQTTQVSDEIQRWSTRNKDPSIEEIKEQFRLSVEDHTRTVLIVDALDELDRVSIELVSHLFDLQRAVGVNLYFTSRDLPHIGMRFKAGTMVVPIKATEHDVGAYLASQMVKPGVPNFIRSNQDVQDEIQKTIISAVGEMFLLAQLQITQLIQSKTRLRLSKALEAISLGASTYEEAYGRAMNRIQSQDKLVCELATNAISILTFAERPLFASELVHALSVDLQFNSNSGSEICGSGDLQPTFHTLGVHDPDLAPAVEDVLAASAGLIVHQSDSDIVQLVHKTTKEYFVSDDGRLKWFPHAQLTIAAICLVYSQAYEDSGDTADWPFLDYARTHYGHHIIAQRNMERCEGTMPVQPPHEESVIQSTSVILKAQQLIDGIGLSRMAQDLGGVEDVLIVACEKNQLNFARVLLSTNGYSRPSGKSAQIQTGSVLAKAACAIDRALLVAVRNGYTELVELLLKHGACPMLEVDDPPHRALSLLALASCKGYHDVVSCLLDHSSNIMAMMEHDQVDQPSWAHMPSVPFDISSPICRAAAFGYPPCVEILWGRICIETYASGQDAEREKILEQATWCAIAHGHMNVLEILPKLTSTNIASLLRHSKHENLLFSVLEFFSKIPHQFTFPDSERKLPGLHHRLDDMAEFICRSYTIDLSVCDDSGRNALARAAEKGRAKIVRLILESREDLLNSQDDSGRTPLSLAMWARGKVAPMDRIKTVRVLLSYKGIQPDIVDVKGRAPIDYALEQWHLNEISSIHPRAPRGFSYASYDIETLESLSLIIPTLQGGINSIDRHGCTLLHSLIDSSYSRRDPSWMEMCPKAPHWSKLERYGGRQIFECRQEWAKLDSEFRSNVSRGPPELDPGHPDPQRSVANLRRVLAAAAASVDQVRSSPCKCGIGTIFLAISMEILEVVEVLLEFYPDLVNDRFFDGSSPLDLARCICDDKRRESMINLILSKNPNVGTP